MAHTNSTTNYNLPQFLPTDKPAWLVDVNPAYASIDTAIKNASDAAGNAQGDATQALADAAGANAIATQANSKADGAIASLAENFLDTATYATGEYVIFNNILYVCTEPVTTPGPWTGSVNWARASVDSIATSLNADVNDLKNRTGSNIPISSDSTSSITSVLNGKFDKSKIRMGKGSYNGLKGGGWSDRVTVNIVFDSPLPTPNYIAFAMINEAYQDFPYIRIYPFSRTSTGFTATCVNLSGSHTGVEGSFDWVAIEL